MRSEIRRGFTPRLPVVAFLSWAMLWTTAFSGVRPVNAQGADSSNQAGAKAPVKTEVFKDCIKYLGGPGFPDFKGHESWNNQLDIGGTQGVCSFAGAGTQPISFELSEVTSILYGQASSRHAGVWVSVGVILAPIALIGLLHKSRKHNVLVSWKAADGKEGGVFFEVQPDHFRRLLNTLAYRTGKPVFADQKDRTWLMTQGVQAQLDPAAATTAK